MTLTERKYCDNCQRNTLWLKENEDKELYEECLFCDWETLEDFWKGEIERDGLDHAKKRWEEIRKGELNKKIWEEMNTEERYWWGQAKEKTDKLFALAKDDEQGKKDRQEQESTDYQPYLIGGCIGSGIMAFLWLIVTLARKD